MIDITDEIQGSLFNLLHGYYRVSASCLRNALELSLYGLYFQTMDNYDNAFKWLSGGNEDLKIFSHIQGLGNVCNQLTKPKQFNQLNFILKKKLGYSLFNQKSGELKPGLSRQLHSKLSKYVHSRPGYTHCDHWNNYEYGPIYSKNSFLKISNLNLETFILIYILIKLAWSDTPIYDNELYVDVMSSQLTLNYESKVLLITLWPELEECLG